MSARPRLGWTGLAALSVLSCGDGEFKGVEAPAAAASSPWVPLEPPRLARRLSLDLRGVLPTSEELDQVEADPEALWTLREEWLADARFEERVVELYAERWRTELDLFNAAGWEFGLAEEEEYDFVRSVGQEPLRLVAHLAATDRPYTQAVTADWTLANPLLLAVFPLEPEAPTPAGATAADWQVARYTDGRPAAGVLATNGLWWRYDSPLFNYSRRRTAAILDLLVCEDILARPVSFGVATEVSGEDAQETILEDPACLTCHATIEPIAVTLFGFQPVDAYSAVEMTRYHPERERDGEATLGVSAAWAGTPVDGLAGLGRAIAADPRFVDCAVETVASGLLRRPVDAADTPLLRDTRDRFVEGSLALRAAFRAVTDHPAYQAGGLSDTAGVAWVDRTPTRRLLAGPQLARAVSTATGLVWERSGADELDNDLTGYRVLAGGVDGEAVTRPLASPGLTYAAVTRRLAQAAARVAVDAHVAGSADALLWSDCGPSDGPDTACFRPALAAMVWQLHAVRAADPDLDAWTDLWTAAHDASGDPAEAWAVVLSALLRDPAFLTY